MNAAFKPASSATTALTYSLYYSSKACFQHMTLREIPIPKSRDLVSHNPVISGFKNGLGSRDSGSRDANSYLFIHGIHGIVYLTGLFLLIPLIHLKLDWINFGTAKILYMILEHSCREPEAAVKCCVRNLSNLVYCKVISRCGHKGFRLRS